MKRALTFTLFALVLWVTAAPAAIPQTVSYQGILRDAGGTIVDDDDYDLTFNIYSVAAGGTALWTETQTLAVENGIFNAILGSVTALGLNFSNPYWLGVSVEGAAELTPRLELTATPYSLNADRLDGLSSGAFAGSAHTHALDALDDVDAPAPGDGQVLSYSSGDGEWVASTLAGPDDGDWTISGDNIYRITGRVGVGTSVAKRPVAEAKADGKGVRAPVAPKLFVYSEQTQTDAAIYGYYDDLDDLADGRAAIFGFRDSNYNNPGSSYTVNGTNNAVTGANWYGDPYSFGVAGYTYYDGPNTGGVLGSEWLGGNWGALGFLDVSSVAWGVYTPYDSYTGGMATVGGFKLSTGGAAGKVLTSNASGVGSWQDPVAGPWSISGDNVYRSLGKVGIGTAPAKQAIPGSKDAEREGRDATLARLQVYASTPDQEGGVYAQLLDYDDDSNARAAVYGLRSSGLNNPGTGFGPYSTNNAITGYNSWGDSYSFGVAGYSYFDNENTGGVLGCNQSGNLWGALGFQDASLANWGVYTPYNAYVGGTLRLPAGAASGRVLTSDVSGNASWQPTAGGSGTAGYIPIWSSANLLGNSVVYQSSGNIGIGTTAPDRRLEVNNNSGNALIGQCTHTTSIDYVGVQGVSAPTDYYGIGGRFEGGYHGVEGLVYPTGGSTYTGLYGYVYGGATGAYKYGVYSYAGGTGTNYAGYFSGNVHVSGTLSKSAGSFKIDHPLDPENKTLSHSFVESPDMKNVYDGTVLLGSDGAAWVELPEWFEALNRDFRYQLTAIGAPGPNLHVAEEVSANHFRIAGGLSGMKVSWQVTGIRQDAYANAHRIPVEEIKSSKDQGRYLSPEAFGQPESRGVDYESNHPELKEGE